MHTQTLEVVTELGVLIQLSHGLRARGRQVGGQSRRETVSSPRQSLVVDHLMGPSAQPAHAGERIAECTRQDVHILHWDPKVLARSTPRLAQDSHPEAVIHHQPETILLLQTHQLWQGCKVTIVLEQPLRDDETALQGAESRSLGILGPPRCPSVQCTTTTEWEPSVTCVRERDRGRGTKEEKGGA